MNTQATRAYSLTSPSSPPCITPDLTAKIPPKVINVHRLLRDPRGGNAVMALSY